MTEHFLNIPPLGVVEFSNSEEFNDFLEFTKEACAFELAEWRADKDKLPQLQAARHLSYLKWKSRA